MIDIEHPGSSLRLVNWNIGGAKYLQLRNREDIKSNPDAERDTKEGSREDFREELNRALSRLLEDDPHVITMQEVTHYHPDGIHQEAEWIVDEPQDYKLFPFILIDTRRHSHQGKWNKVRRLGNWGDNAYFGQGNAMLVRRDLLNLMFPVMSLPKSHVTYDEWLKRLSPTDAGDLATHTRTEDVLLDPGIYMGNRDTEPRAASIIHLCLPRDEPLDVFIINTHLVTLTKEREGVPSVDKEASRRRLAQLDIIFDRIISPYNLWRKDGYRVRDEDPTSTHRSTEDRRSPIWIVAGDYNFTPESVEYRHILGQNFRDLIKHHGRGTKTSGLGENPTLTVDYVFAGPLFESLDPHALEPTLAQNSVEVSRVLRVSDHFPVIVSVPLDTLET